MSPPSVILLIFELNDAKFAFDAKQVRETIWLPELTPVEEAQPSIVGVFSLRGTIVPVIDLNVHFGHSVRPYCLSDQIVVMEEDLFLIGVIVNTVCDVIEIPSDQIQLSPIFSGVAPSASHSRVGELSINGEIVTLLDAKKLLHEPPDFLVSELMASTKRFSPQATLDEYAVFRTRARALMEINVDEREGYLPMAVVVLGSEYFGFELGAVQEFCEIKQITPIPCCPSHILGVINLRGNLLTLLDLRGALNLPREADCGNKVVVAHFDVSVVGVVVDQVHDVIYLHADELRVPPQALTKDHFAEVKCTAMYKDQMMTILDLSVLLARKEWIVNETV